MNFSSLLKELREAIIFRLLGSWLVGLVVYFFYFYCVIHMQILTNVNVGLTNGKRHQQQCQ